MTYLWKWENWGWQNASSWNAAFLLDDTAELMNEFFNDPHTSPFLFFNLNNMDFISFMFIDIRNAK